MTKPKPKQQQPKTTPQQVLQTYYDNIESRYGASIAEWMSRIRATGLTKHSEVVHWLKTEHGLGHGHATLLAQDALHDDSLMSRKYGGERPAAGPSRGHPEIRRSRIRMQAS